MISTCSVHDEQLLTPVSPGPDEQLKRCLLWEVQGSTEGIDFIALARDIEEQAFTSLATCSTPEPDQLGVLRQYAAAASSELLEIVQDMVPQSSDEADADILAEADPADGGQADEDEAIKIERISSPSTETVDGSSLGLPGGAIQRGRSVSSAFSTYTPECLSRASSSIEPVAGSLSLNLAVRTHSISRFVNLTAHAPFHPIFQSWCQRISSILSSGKPGIIGEDPIGEDPRAEGWGKRIQASVPGQLAGQNL